MRTEDCLASSKKEAIGLACLQRLQGEPWITKPLGCCFSGVYMGGPLSTKAGLASIEASLQLRSVMGGYQCPAGATDAVICEHHALGGEGAVDLAKAIIKATETPPNFKFLYGLDLPIKVIIICKYKLSLPHLFCAFAYEGSCACHGC